jgi:Flagellar hook-length control protein FliK
MRIDLLSANDSRTTVTTTPRPLWRIGTILEAIAIRDAASGQLWLQLADQRLPARLASGHSHGPLDGELLKLRVLRDTPVLALESLEEPSADYSTEDALRRYLPRQASPTPLLANLGWLARNPAQRQALPHAVQQALATLWQALPDAARLQQPTQLAQALLHSGTFLEAQLAEQPINLGPVIAADFKAALLALREQLRGLQLESRGGQQPPGVMPTLRAPLATMATGPASLSVLDSVANQLSEIQQQAEGTLARITTNQLLNAAAAQQGLFNLLIEVPIKHDNRAQLLRFRLEREPRRQGSGADTWTVEVALDLGASGALHAQLKLTGKRLNVQLRSESAALVTALGRQLPALKHELQAQGLELERVVCLHGQPVDTGSRLTRLLDLHA